MNHVKAFKLDDFFKDLTNRAERGVYFYRISGFNDEIKTFVKKYYESARNYGIVIEGKLQNPDEKNLAYYNEIMGMNFRMNREFISSSLKKWLPRMNDRQRQAVSDSMYDSLEAMRREGKNDNMLRNAYIKYMCWLYYRFESVTSKLGNNSVPKILYDGDISNYELVMMSILSKAGCDIVLLEYKGDANYLKYDPRSLLSDLLPVTNAAAFPDGYSLKRVREEMQEDRYRESLCGPAPPVSNCTNAWMQGGRILDEIKKPAASRGNDGRFYYNCLCRINGVEDKPAYTSELFKFHEKLISDKRNVVVIGNTIPPATVEELNLINRRPGYKDIWQMLTGLCGNIKYSQNTVLQKLFIKAFVDVMLEWAGNETGNDTGNGTRTGVGVGIGIGTGTGIGVGVGAGTGNNSIGNRTGSGTGNSAGTGNRTINMNKAIGFGTRLLCWLKRYQTDLFKNWKYPEVGCFIHMGTCKNEAEAFFLKFLSRLPVDVLILAPDLNEARILTDKLLYEQNYTDSMETPPFPKDATGFHMETLAYHAERELDTLMYQDSGIYRNQQYAKADSITLRTMFEEIKILWKEDVKYRQGFETKDGVVKIPVIFAKVSGVKDGNEAAYWEMVRELITDDVFLIKSAPFIEGGTPNPMKAYAPEFLKNGRVQKERIKAHKHYQYGFLREEVQEHILDKLKALIDGKLIKGIQENGTEFTVIATILNLDKDILRKIQNFDFTKRNPKLLYINTGETMISLEDSIIIAFLNLIGFDILLLVPTGYRTVERYFNSSLMEEHQIGEYMYDLHTPDLSKTAKPGRSWRDILFGRF